MPYLFHYQRTKKIMYKDTLFIPYFIYRTTTTELRVPHLRIDTSAANNIKAGFRLYRNKDATPKYPLTTSANDADNNNNNNDDD